MPEFTFGQPAVFAIFRGGGNLVPGFSGSGESGMETLNARLKDAFPDFYLISEVFDSYEGNIFSFREVGSRRGRAFVDRLNDDAALGFVGYSAGGLSSIRLAKSLTPRPVNLLVQLDSYEPLTGASPEDEVLPNNVAKGINYYQNSNPLNVTDLQGARNVQGSENINVEALLGDNSITHLSIENNAALQAEILADINEFVLQDLSFDPAGELTLSGGAEFIGNTLSLAPEGSVAGQALLADPIAINPDFSFSTRFEFRLEPGNTSVLPGFSWVVQPASPNAAAAALSPLEVAFAPILPGPVQAAADAVFVLTPDIATEPLAQTTPALNLDSGEPLTAWVDYNGTTDALSVFLSESRTRPATPLLTAAVDLFAIAGEAAQFGFAAIVGDAPRQAELLTWELTPQVVPPVAPAPYLNFGLTRRATAAFLGQALPLTPFSVGGLEFSTLFDEAVYLRLHADVRNAVTAGGFATGYDHFTQVGWLEGRHPSSLYNEAFYLATNEDVAAAVRDGLLASGFQHFVQNGHIEGRDPSSRFSQADYLAANGDVAAAIAQGALLSAFEHYVEHGAAEGRDPQLLLFQEGYYLAQNSDVAAAVSSGAFVDGFDHFLSFGCREGRDPSAFFDSDQYLALNTDVAAAVAMGSLPCGWTHYVQFGRFEGRPI